MKKVKTIYILPEISKDLSFIEIAKCLMATWEMAATIDYIPDSLKTLRAIDYMQLKALMIQNDNFFNAAVELCSDYVNGLIKDQQEIAEEMYENEEIDEDVYKAMQEVKTLDDLLNAGYYCDDYKSSKGEFINNLLEDYLYRKNTRK